MGDGESLLQAALALRAHALDANMAAVTDYYRATGAGEEDSGRGRCKAGAARSCV